ncbi:DUF1488 family protein [Noviherbaspirillum sp. UKPF54]|uniref:DUF1488 family protein n=1 Tax=Noviherbaspirillum sp. UKPF54 TaxID=2601898 RepID=UPI0011B12282|nr:DUF1488 family protein [Noviherbaspirillum sp. UKPF54]QDZ26817.1 DUF1488 family protein [Noviherbaspirillum sp. UKPF54]
MNQPLNAPRLSPEGVAFTVVVDYARRDCLITTQALCKLRAVDGDNPHADIMGIFKTFEAYIHGIARRLAAAGVTGSPLILRPETFASPRTR